MKELMNWLADACVRLDRSCRLNSGGCLYAAWTIAKELERREMPFLVSERVRQDGTLYHLSVVADGADSNPCDREAGCETRTMFMTAREIQRLMRAVSGRRNPLYKDYRNKDVRKVILDVFKKYDGR